MLKYKIPQIVTLTLLLLPLSYGELYKTKIAIISFPMIAITSCTPVSYTHLTLPTIA